jgi:hypothetical protein
MKNLTICFCFTFIYLGLFAQAGKVLRESNCASGGNDYYFFANGDVVVVESVAGSLSNDHISVGTWKSNGDKNSVDITIEYSKFIKPAPDAQIKLPVGSKTEYDKYIAVYEKVNNKPKAISIPEGTEEGCEVYEKHTYKSSADLIDACLRNNGKRTYAFVSYRALNETELQKYSLEELRIMRNEIYASYGYIFKDLKLKSYFQSKGFYGYMTSVDAFLNDFEQSNIQLIKKVEKQKGQN